MKTLSREEVQSRIDENKPINLVEASSKEDFDKAHLPGAFRMTADEAKAGAQHRLQDKNAEVIAYCGGNGCDASTKLATELENQGYNNVSVFKGGKAEWNEAGFPTENGNKAATANTSSGGAQFGENRQEKAPVAGGQFGENRQENAPAGGAQFGDNRQGNAPAAGDQSDKNKNRDKQR